ncbi:MAG: hypothetical protein IAF38_02365 [Bacteroidia bacterium]|nr:hypothetical protein [Bacteroidia bacterium]
MKKFSLITLICFLSFIIYFSCKKKDYKNVDCSALPHTYSANIKPLINSNCAIPGCHVTGFPQGDFTSYSGVKASVNGGTFADAVLYKKTMPQSGALSKDDRQKIKCWIDEGAPNN